MKVKNYSDLEISIFGNGTIGSKTEEFVSKTNTLRTLGFHTTPKTILSYDLIKPLLESDMKHLDLFEELLHPLNQAIKNQTKPLMVRLSANSDSRGTGIYASIPSMPDINKLKEVLKEVANSYRSENAVEFRRINNISEGAGIIIEPLVEQEIGENWGHIFGPLVSGMGYTSTLKGGPYINISPGMFGGVSTRPSIKIPKELVLENENDFVKIVKTFSAQKRKGSYDDFYPSKYFFGTFEGYDWNAHRGVMFFEEGRIDLPSFFNYKKYAFGSNIFHSAYNLSDESKSAMKNIDLNDLFEKMIKLESVIGNPQYLELALTNKTTYEWWINQISDVNKEYDFVDFKNIKNPMVNATNVVGNGLKKSNLILDFSNLKHSSEELYNFNKTHKDYVLILDFDYVGFEGRELGFSYYSNASTILVVDSGISYMDGTLEKHLGGSAKVSGKLLGLINENDISKFQKNNSSLKVSDTLYSGSFEALGSEPLDKLILHQL